jgi:hypothetical protein
MCTLLLLLLSLRLPVVLLLTCHVCYLLWRQSPVEAAVNDSQITVLTGIRLSNVHGYSVTSSVPQTNTQPQDVQQSRTQHPLARI